MNRLIAKMPDGQVLKRGDIVVMMADARNRTFAYVADDGRIATQEPGYLPVLHPARRVHGVTVMKEDT